MECHHETSWNAQCQLAGPQGVVMPPSWQMGVSRAHLRAPSHPHRSCPGTANGLGVCKAIRWRSPFSLRVLRPWWPVLASDGNLMFLLGAETELSQVWGKRLVAQPTTCSVCHRWWPLCHSPPGPVGSSMAGTPVPVRSWPAGLINSFWTVVATVL